MSTLPLERRRESKILIFREVGDESSRKVIKWLERFGVPYLDIFEHEANDLIAKIEISNADVSILFEYQSSVYDLCDFEIIWFRRAHFTFGLPELDSSEISDGIKDAINVHINRELETMNKFIYDYVKENALVVNDPYYYNYNKLLAIINAKKVGLKVPNTLIAKLKSDVQHFNKGNDGLVTKNIQDVFNFIDDKNKVSWYQSTRNVNFKDMPETFFYSLFQENLMKKYEIRTFVFLDKIFSMAMYTQSFDGSLTDSRLYEKGNPISMVPYKLPQEIEHSLFEFMKLSNLKSGSIDLIYDGVEYTFLEVNPVGQFDYVSGYGGYAIEKEIALRFKEIIE